MDFSEISGYIKSHPKAAAAAAIGGGGIAVLGYTKRKNAATPEKPTTTTSPDTIGGSQTLGGTPNDYSNYPVINVNLPDTGKTPGEATEPGRSFEKIVRDGRTHRVTAGPPGICPPGYVSAQQPGQPVRCTLATDAHKKPHQRTSFIPSHGQSAYGK